MSQHGRGSGPHDDDADGEETAKERPSRDSSLPPAAAPPIAPYDPYRPMTGDRPRLPTRNVADDPLNAEAWQLELDDAPLAGDDEARRSELNVDVSVPPRQSRRQPSSVRSGRE